MQHELPNNVILIEDNIFDVSEGGKRWIQVDLEKHNIQLRGHKLVAATLQWVQGKRGKPLLGKYYSFDIPATLSNPLPHTVVYRGASQGKRQALRANMSFYCNATCYEE